MVGCERCMMDYGCEIEAKAVTDLQAYYQCPHALLPLNDATEECHCQTSILSSHLRSAATSSDRTRATSRPRQRIPSERSHKP
ncbi:unnamed protein product, partial [Mesorhabditis belari]